MTARRALLAVALAAMVGVLGWRVVAAELARRAPPPEGTAAERLSRAPLDGDAFADLAVSMRATGAPADVLRMHQLAARRDPRDLRIRAWLADHYLRTLQYPEGMAQLDVLLRLSPEFRETLPPMIAGWADDPAFAAVLADKLRERPAWARPMMAALAGEVARPGAGGVLAALHASGDLDEAARDRWLGALMRAGQWDLARRHWVRGIGMDEGSVPLVYNGNFELPPSEGGFNWRTGRRAGSYTEFVPTLGADGRAARVVFAGRKADLADLEQALALPPGRYRLSMSARSVSLRSDQGFRWQIECHGRSRAVAEGEALNGTFDWRRLSLEIDIPSERCPGQWLRLANPAPRGSARITAGELWFDDVEIVSVAGSGAPAR